MQTITQQLHKRGFNSFDLLVWCVSAGLIAAITLTVALGDNVGVQIIRAEPGANAHSTEPILIEFSERMNRESVAENLRIEPDITGEIAWSGNTLIFQPEDALRPDTNYTVTVTAGVESSNGRALLDDLSFMVDVRTPRVAYLAPATAFPQNIYIANPNNPDDTRQVTDTPTGIFDFNVSPDGTRIAYAEYEDDFEDVNIKVLDLESAVVNQVTNCRDATCTNPVWRPDGQALAYHRVEANTGLTGVGRSATRVWLVELTGDTFNNRPVFDDYQIVGYSPRWSDNGQRIAIYDPTASGILVHDLRDKSIQMIPSWNGTMGALSPDGYRVVYPDIDPAMTSPIRNYLQMADLKNNEINLLTNLDEGVDDTLPVWHPNGRDLAIGRRYVDERFTQGSQIYLLNSETGAAEPLVYDPDYNHGFFSWDPTGSQIVMQRFNVSDAQSGADSKTEVWTYNRETDALIQVAVDAFLPQWVP